MGKIVQVLADYSAVLLPNNNFGQLYSAGQSCALTSQEFDGLPTSSMRAIQVTGDVDDDSVPERKDMTILRPVSTIANLVWTGVKTAAYTAKSNDAIPCDTTSTAFTVTLGALATDSKVRVKWMGGANAPTVAVTGANIVLDPTWPGFGQVGDSADFHLQGTTWMLV